MRVVVNHLRFKDPLPKAVIDAAEEVCRRLVEAGGLAPSTASSQNRCCFEK